MKTKTKTLRRQRHEATAQAMLDAAERAMIRHGYQRATMQQIATETGCAAGTFYLYFKNKQVLIEAILVRHLEGMYEAARAAATTVADPLEKVRQTLGGILGYWHGREASLRLVLSAWPVRVRVVRERLSRIGWRENAVFREEMEGHIREAQKKGLVRRDLPPDTLMDFIDGVGLTMVEAFSLSPAGPSLEDRIRILWGLLTGGLLHQETT
jgi:AcrR family transcriptional regulator